MASILKTTTQKNKFKKECASGDLIAIKKYDLYTQNKDFWEDNLNFFRECICKSLDMKKFNIVTHLTNLAGIKNNAIFNDGDWLAYITKSLSKKEEDFFEIFDYFLKNFNLEKTISLNYLMLNLLKLNALYAMKILDGSYDDYFKKEDLDNYFLINNLLKSDLVESIEYFIRNNHINKEDILIFLIDSIKNQSEKCTKFFFNEALKNKLSLSDVNHDDVFSAFQMALLMGKESFLTYLILNVTDEDIKTIKEIVDCEIFENRDFVVNLMEKRELNKKLNSVNFADNVSCKKTKI